LQQPKIENRKSKIAISIRYLQFSMIILAMAFFNACGLIRRSLLR